MQPKPKPRPSVVLSKKMTDTLAKLHNRHALVAHIWQIDTKTIEVEFEFPYRYLIFHDGDYQAVAVP